MKLANLETFVQLARLRHFGRTAHKLNATQPAISSRLVALEKELGAQLIVREGRSFRLTPAGREALRTIERMLGDFNDLKTSLRNSEDSMLSRQAVSRPARGRMACYRGRPPKPRATACGR
jgi:DNA-binding transcriptional LysR family regulator